MLPYVRTGTVPEPTAGEDGRSLCGVACAVWRVRHKNARGCCEHFLVRTKDIGEPGVCGLVSGIYTGKTQK